MVEIANFRFDDPSAAFDRGYSRVNDIRLDRAGRQAGSALATGNYQGAANTLYGAGDLANGSRVQAAGEARAEQKRQQDLAARTALLKFTGEAFQNLALVHQQSNGDVNQLGAAYDLLAPQFARMGEPPEEIAKVRAALIANPAATLTALRDGVQKEMEPFTLNPGDQRFVGGKVVASVAPKQEYQAVPEGGKLVPVPQGGPMAAAAPQMAPQIATVPAGGQPRNQRNRNPGNIEDGPFARSLPGYAGSDGRFAIFDNDENGANASVQLLKSYGTRGLNTVAGIINRWAPPSDSNPTPAYVNFVSQQLGVGPNQPLNMSDQATLSDLAMAIQRFEGGTRSASNGPPTTQQAARAGDPAGTIYGNPKPQVRDLTPQEVAQRGFLPGTIVQQKPDGTLDTVQSPNNTAGPRKAEADLRKEFNALPEVKDYKTISTAVQQIKALARPNASAQDDLALGFAFMRAQDPNSVVREGEFAQVAKSVGLDQQLQMAFARLDQGKGFTPELRAALAKTAERILVARKAAYDAQVENFRSYAQDYGVDPGRVVQAPQLGGAQTGAPQGARQGRNGKYYYQDPNKPGSWPEIRPTPSGKWAFKSADGAWYGPK